MILTTEHLGEIEYSQEAILKFPQGIPGFDNEKQFILIPSGDIEFPFSYLQSVMSNDLAFVVTDPFLFVDNYDFELSKSDAEILCVANEFDLENLSFFTIVTIPENVEETTINIMAPIIINIQEKCGKQILLNEYDEIKYLIFKKKNEA